MDKYEYKVRIEEIKELTAQGEYIQAAEMADSIDWSREKKPAILCGISDIYKKARRYEDAISMLQMAYDINPGSKDIVFSLGELFVKTNDTIQAVECYKEFIQMAPKDARRYILQYRIYEAQDVSLEERIEVLEELKNRDYREKWAYALAYLYHRVGLATKCVEECDELILWFGDGRYVYKAMELKALHAPLTPAQQAKYDARFNPTASVEMTESQDAYQNADYVDNDGYVENAQYVNNAEYVENYGYMENAEYVDNSGYAENAEYSGYIDNSAYASNTDNAGYTESVAYQENVSDVEAPAYAENSVNYDILGHTQVFHGIGDPNANIEVKPVDVGQLGTMNLQAAIAAGINEVLDGPDGQAAMIFAGSTGEIEEVVLENDEPKVVPKMVDTGKLAYIPENEQRLEIGIEPLEENVEETAEVISEDTFEATTEETPEVPEASNETTDLEEEETPEEVVDERDRSGAVVYSEDGISRTVYPNGMKPGDEDVAIRATYDTANVYSQYLEEALAVQPPSHISDVLKQEADGQIGLIVPEEVKEDRQITGQINIADVMIEWDRMKREHEEKNRRQLEEQVKRNTGKMFDEFEAAVLNSVLDQLDREAREEAERKAKALEQGEDVEVETFFSEEDEIPEDVIGPDDEIEEIEEIEEIQEVVTSDLPVEEILLEHIQNSADVFDDAPATEISETEETEEETEEILESEIPDEDTDTEEAVSTSELEKAEKESENTEEVKMTLEEEIDAKSSSDDAEAADDDAEDTENTEVSENTDDSDDAEDSEEEDNISDLEDTALPGERILTQEEKELFGLYIQTKKARRQLATVLDTVSMAAYTGNVLLAGDDGTDTLTLATSLMKAVKQSDSEFTGKVAKIDGVVLNDKVVADTVGQLENGGLIIEGASAMNDETVDALIKSLEQERMGIVITMLDTKKGIRQLLERKPELEKVFNARMNVEALSEKKLVAFAKQYALEREFAINEMGALALHTQIAQRQSLNHAVNVLEVKEIVDKAIEHVTRKTPAHFFDVILGKRYDEEDMIVLGEKDFID